MIDQAEDTALKEPTTPDEIADFYAGAAPLGTYEIYLPSGRPITCRYPQRYGEVRQFFRELKVFAELWNDPENLVEELKPFAPLDWAEAYAVYLLHYWSDESTKFSQKSAAKLAKNAWVLDSLRSQIEKNQKAVVELVARQEIADAGNASTETNSGGPVSESALTSSTAIPTA